MDPCPCVCISSFARTYMCEGLDNPTFPSSSRRDFKGSMQIIAWYPWRNVVGDVDTDIIMQDPNPVQKKESNQSNS